MTSPLAAVKCSLPKIHPNGFSGGECRGRQGGVFLGQRFIRTD